MSILIYFVFLKSIVFHKLVKEHNENYTLKKAFKTTLNVHFFQAITPFSSGGQPYEIYALTKEDIKLTTETSISIQHFIMYQLGLVILGMMAVTSNYFFHIFPGNSILKRLVVIGFLLNFLVIVVLFTFSFAKKWNNFLVNRIICFLGKMKIVKRPEEKIKEFESYVTEFHKGADTLIKRPKLFISGVLINIWALSIFYLIPLLIFFSFGYYHEINAFQAIVTTAYVMIIGSVIPLPGGSGGLEFSFVEFYSMMYSGKIIIAAMLMWRLVTYYIPMIIGAVSTNIKEGESK